MNSHIRGASFTFCITLLLSTPLMHAMEEHAAGGAPERRAQTPPPPPGEDAKSPKSASRTASDAIDLSSEEGDAMPDLEHLDGTPARRPDDAAPRSPRTPDAAGSFSGVMGNVVGLTTRVSNIEGQIAEFRNNTAAQGMTVRDIQAGRAQSEAELARALGEINSNIREVRAVTDTINATVGNAVTAQTAAITARLDAHRDLLNTLDANIAATTGLVETRAGGLATRIDTEADRITAVDARVAQHRAWQQAPATQAALAGGQAFASLQNHFTQMNSGRAIAAACLVYGLWFKKAVEANVPGGATFAKRLTRAMCGALSANIINSFGNYMGFFTGLRSGQALNGWKVMAAYVGADLAGCYGSDYFAKSKKDDTQKADAQASDNTEEQTEQATCCDNQSLGWGTAKFLIKTALAIGATKLIS